MVGFHRDAADRKGGAPAGGVVEVRALHREALEDAGLLSKEKLLAGDIMPGFAGNEERDGLLETDK